jgi:hypothetical protein
MFAWQASCYPFTTAVLLCIDEEFNRLGKLQPAKRARQMHSVFCSALVRKRTSGEAVTRALKQKYGWVDMLQGSLGYEGFKYLGFEEGLFANHRTHKLALAPTLTCIHI